jgi:predicted ATPase
MIQGVAVKEAFPPETTTAWDKRTMQRVELDVQGDRGSYQYELVLLHDVSREEVSIHRETVRLDESTLFLYEDETVHLYDNQGQQGTEFPYRGRQSFLAQIQERPETTHLIGLLNHIRRLRKLKLEPRAMDPENGFESDTLDEDGANFSSWYRHLSQEHPERIANLFEHLRNALPGFRSLKNVGAGKPGRRYLVAQYDPIAGTKSSYEVDFDDLADGERALIALYCLLMESEADPHTLLLDEPENYVGLSEIQPWLVDLAEAVRSQGQLFLISHHPEVIDYLAADHTLLFDRPGGGPSRVIKQPFDRDRGLKASELVARGLIDGD